MASVVNWQQESVDSFLGQVNWLGLRMTVPDSPERRNWLDLSVREFWQDWNWEGKPSRPSLAWGAPVISARFGEQPWLNWSVAEFIQATNWTGRPLSPSEPAMEVTPIHQPVPSSWLQLSLTDFFERVNWLGKPEQSQPLPGMQSPLQLSVATFLNTVAWDMKPLIAAMPPPILPPEPEPEPTMTLTDLSSLF